MSLTLRLTALLLVAGLLPAGCGLGRSNPATPRLTFHYSASGADGTMSQLLTITNPTGTAVVPYLRLVALDVSGDLLPGVRVATVYGSDHGAVLVPMRSQGIDVLRFSGDGVGRVADVRVTLERFGQPSFPPVDFEPQVTPLAADGTEVTRNDDFTRVRIANDNGTAVTVRLVYIVWDMPPDDQNQQALHTAPVGDLIDVPAHGETEVAVGAEAATLMRHYSNYPTSIKAYFAG